MIQFVDSSYLDESFQFDDSSQLDDTILLAPPWGLAMSRMSNETRIVLNHQIELRRRIEITHGEEWIIDSPLLKGGVVVANFSAVMRPAPS